MGELAGVGRGPGFAHLFGQLLGPFGVAPIAIDHGKLVGCRHFLGVELERLLELDGSGGGIPAFYQHLSQQHARLAGAGVEAHRDSRSVLTTTVSSTTAATIWRSDHDAAAPTAPNQ